VTGSKLATESSAAVVAIADGSLCAARSSCADGSSQLAPSPLLDPHLQPVQVCLVPRLLPDSDLQLARVQRIRELWFRSCCLFAGSWCECSLAHVRCWISTCTWLECSWSRACCWIFSYSRCEWRWIHVGGWILTGSWVKCSWFHACCWSLTAAGSSSAGSTLGCGLHWRFSRARCLAPRLLPGSHSRLQNVQVQLGPNLPMAPHLLISSLAVGSRVAGSMLAAGSSVAAGSNAAGLTLADVPHLQMVRVGLFSDSRRLAQRFDRHPE
jgi:hypothetical protein